MTGTGDGKASKTEKLGYLGLGMMGIPMARRLLNARHELAVWNRSAGKAAALVEAGPKLAADPRGIAESVSIVLQLFVPRMVQGPRRSATSPRC